MTLLLLLAPPASTALGSTYGGDFASAPGTGVKRPEYVYLGLEALDNQGVSGNKVPQVAKWRTASAVTAPGAGSRLRQLAAVAGGNLHVQGISSWDTFDDPTDPTLDAGAVYTWGFVHNQSLYLGDGLSYMVYDPRDGTLAKWESTGAGAMPEKCRLATVYRGRVVLARPASQPQNWYMSAMDEPTIWDFFPKVITTDQAVFGNNAPAGLCPDIVNTLIPHNDDMLIFGCDSSIWRLAGDPMEGGSFERLSDSTGIAFGKPWCKDPSGVIYFFGSKGGVYRMHPGGAPQYLSDNRDGQDVSVQQRLASIDLAVYRIEMAWDFERQGLVVVQVPYEPLATAVPLAYFWDSKNNAWWEDEPGVVGLTPYTVRSLDGDLPGDRRLVYGCQDGWLREVDESATSDDGTAIHAEVTLGPLASGLDVEIMLNRAKAVLAREQSGCTFEVYASDEPNRLGRMVAQGEFTAGQNPRLSIRKRGAFMWLLLRNTRTGERFALEELAVDVRRMGLRKVRS